MMTSSITSDLNHIKPITSDLNHRKPRVLLGLTGSVASVKCRELFSLLSSLNYDVQIVATQSALHFVALSEEYENNNTKKRLNEAISLYNSSSLSTQNKDDKDKTQTQSINKQQYDDSFKVISDKDEWKSYQNIGGGTRGLGDPVLHIELRKWADIFLIAPLSANTLAKIANGLCDNLLTSIARAWEFNNESESETICPLKPIIIAPAMNTAMWKHPLTKSHLKSLSFLGYTIIPPTQKILACGDLGDGALASVEEIVNCVAKSIVNHKIQQQQDESDEISPELKEIEKIPPEERFTRC
jgi:phosphopantothenoylcysteine decarboxylase